MIMLKTFLSLTSKHPMQINEKRNELTMEDLRAFGRNMDISVRRIKESFGDIVEVVKKWAQYAEYAGVSEQVMERVRSFHKY